MTQTPQKLVKKITYLLEGVSIFKLQQKTQPNKKMTDEITPTWECLICRSQFAGPEPKSLSALSCTCMQQRVSNCDECIGKDACLRIKEGTLPQCVLCRRGLGTSLPALLHAILAKGLMTPEVYEIGVKRALDVAAAKEAEQARRFDLGLDNDDRPPSYETAHIGSLVDKDHPYISFSGRAPKRCPFCGMACIRISGCRHMTCFTCNNDFRWCCAAKGTDCYDWCGGTDADSDGDDEDSYGSEDY